MIFAHLEVTDFTVSSITPLADAVGIFGSYSARSRDTGRQFVTPFAQRAEVSRGLVSKCLMLEDSHAVASAINGRSPSDPAASESPEAFR